MESKTQKIKDFIESEIQGSNFYYSVTIYDKENYHCFIENDNYIVECTCQTTFSYRPYHNVMLSLATVDTGIIEHWCDSELMEIDEIYQNIKRMIRYITY